MQVCFSLVVPVSDLLQQSRTEWPPLPSSHHQPSLCPAPRPNAEASLLLSTQSCSTPWPRAVPHYRAVRKLLGAPVTLKDWWRKMGWRRGEEQVVKKRMSCLMGCQECNSIIMKSDSGELDGWAAEWRPRGAVDPLNMPEHPHPPGWRKQVNGLLSQKYWRLFVPPFSGRWIVRRKVGGAILASI